MDRAVPTGTVPTGATRARKGVNYMSRETLNQRIAEAWALVRKGDDFDIGRRFLMKHGAI